jgi:hypothetical protein
MYNIACAILFATLTYRFVNEDQSFDEPKTFADTIVVIIPVLMWAGSFICAILP